MEKIQSKAERCLRVAKWFLSFFVILIVSLPGIIISIQYSTDTCVTKTNYVNIELDEWLLAASFGYIFITLLYLPCVCCKVRKRWFRISIVLFSVVGILWGALGIYLVCNSDLKNCTHDSLWIMTLVSLTSLGFFILIELVYALFLICRWRQQTMYKEEIEDGSRFAWLDEYEFE